MQSKASGSVEMGAEATIRRLFRRRVRARDMAAQSGWLAVVLAVALTSALGAFGPAHGGGGLLLGVMLRCGGANVLSAAVYLLGGVGLGLGAFFVGPVGGVEAVETLSIWLAVAGGWGGAQACGGVRRPMAASRDLLGVAVAGVVYVLILGLLGGLARPEATQGERTLVLGWSFLIYLAFACPILAWPTAPDGDALWRGWPRLAAGGWLWARLGGAVTIALLWPGGGSLALPLLAVASVALAWGVWVISALLAGALFFAYGLWLHHPAALMADVMRPSSMAGLGALALLPLGVALVLAERDKLTADLRFLARHDRLTGLCNRAGLEAAAAEMLDSAQVSVTILLIDLDQFKGVNDRWGHRGGDAVLQRFSERLRRNLRGGDVLARMGGDEFAVLIADLSLVQAAQIANRLRAAVAARPFAAEELGAGVEMTLSLGMCYLPRAEIAKHSLDAGLDAADAALYRAKRQGGNQVDIGKIALQVERGRV